MVLKIQCSILHVTCHSLHEFLRDCERCIEGYFSLKLITLNIFLEYLRYSVLIAFRSQGPKHYSPRHACLANFIFSFFQYVGFRLKMDSLINVTRIWFFMIVLKPYTYRLFTFHLKNIDCKALKNVFVTLIKWCDDHEKKIPRNRLVMSGPKKMPIPRDEFSVPKIF